MRASYVTYPSKSAIKPGHENLGISNVGGTGTLALRLGFPAVSSDPWGDRLDARLTNLVSQNVSFAQVRLKLSGRDPISRKTEARSVTLER